MPPMCWLTATTICPAKLLTHPVLPCPGLSLVPARSPSSPATACCGCANSTDLPLTTELPAGPLRAGPLPGAAR